MIRKLLNEKWKPFEFDGHKKLRNRYAISSEGRIASYKNDLSKDGKILKGSLTSGYRTFNIHTGGRSSTLYIHREVAKHFVPGKSDVRKIVIHLNHDKTDNRSKNLKWVSLANSINHQQDSPARKDYKERQQSRKKGMKLTLARAKAIKSILSKPRRRLTNKQLAEKYGVSEMTIYRIKRGESWPHA